MVKQAANDRAPEIEEIQKLIASRSKDKANILDYDIFRGLE